MKLPKSIRRILPFPACILVGAVVTHSAQAANQIWDGGGGDANWSTVNNWVGSSAAPGDTAVTNNTDVATFYSAIANTWGDVGSPIVIDSATQNLGGISFDAAAGNYNIGSTAGPNSLLLSSGGTIQILATLAASDAVETLNAPLSIQGAAGTYTLANNSASGAGAGVGTLVVGGGITGTGAGASVLTLSGSNTNANTLSGSIGNGTATTLGITKSGTGTWVLSGANSFSGPVVVNDGILTMGALPTTTTALTLSGGTLSLGTGDVAVTVNSATTTGTGTLNLVGVGTKTLTSLGTGYDGNIGISASPVQAANRDPNGTPGSAGVVSVAPGGVSAFGSAVGSTTITNSGTGLIFVKNPVSATALAENFVINAGAGLVSFGTTTFSATRSGNIQLNSGTLLLNNGGYFTTNSGVISGPGNIAVLNPGDVLTGPNTFSGGISMGLGTVPAIWSGNYGITQGVTVGGGDTLSGGAILNGPIGTGTLTLGTATRTTTGSPRFADAGQASTTLHNNVVQRNAVTFCSQTLVGSSITLVTNANTMTFTDVGLTVPSTWTLEPCPNVYSNVPLDLGLGIAGTTGSSLPHIMGINCNTNYTAEIDQVIGENMLADSGHMTLRKIGVGTLILGRVNTYGGDTMAMQGTLKLGVNNALPTGTKLAVGGGTYLVADWPELGLVPPVATPLGVNLTGNTIYGTFDLNGFNQTVSGIGQSSDSVLPTNNTITNSSATVSNFTVNNAVANSFGGTFSGNLNLVKGGAGTLTQNSTSLNNYTGNTTVNAGILSLVTTNANNDASTVIIASSGATLDLNFGGTEVVDKLYIGSTPMAAGVYGPSATSIPQITGTGTLTVNTTGPALNSYTTWAAANAGGQAANLDFDHDGMANGVEYFMGATGSTFTPNPPLVNTAGVRTVTWPRDPAATASFKVQVSNDLTTWTDVVPPDPSIDTSNPNQVTYTLPSVDPRKFCRLVVTTP